ncbi:hypothetical protein IWZ01DRAFT_481258 [Phyllosticta capitalensis]
MAQQQDLGRVLRQRCDEAWGRFEAGEKREAYLKARSLLLEPLLSELLKAHCYMLLTSAEDDMAVEHGEKACALYLRGLDSASPVSAGFYSAHLKKARRLLEKAREREAEEKKRWVGMSPGEIVDAKIEEMLTELEAENKKAEERDGYGAGDDGSAGRQVFKQQP